MHQLHIVRLPARNPNAARLVEHFLIVSVTTIVATRVLLGLTGYPELGGPGLHIAHMLWGGLLMLAALLGLFIFVGRPVKETAAVVGGAGFGLFIDEVGKFVTRDNDYFFQPSFAIMYGIFVILFVLFRQLSLPSLSRQGRAQAPEGIMEQLATPWTTHVVLVVFCFTAFLQLFLSVAVLDSSLDFWSIGGLISTAVVVLLVIRGVWLRNKRWSLSSLHALHVAVILSLLVVQFFDFYQAQLLAIFYVLVNLAAYATIDYRIRKLAHHTN